MHLPVIVRLAGEFSGIGIIAIGGQRRVVDHGGLEMEAAVAEVEDEVCLAARKTRRSAAENLALAERCDLWDQDLEAGTLEDGLHGMERGVKLDCPYHGDSLTCLEVPLQGR